MKAISDSTTLRFKSRTRIKAIETSMKQLGDDNLSEWLRHAIDMRIYLEQRGVSLDDVLSGSLLDRLETNKSVTPSVIEGLDRSVLVEQLQAVLRIHGMTKIIMTELLSNPNISNSNEDPAKTFEMIKGRTELFTNRIINGENDG